MSQIEEILYCRLNTALTAAGATGTSRKRRMNFLARAAEVAEIIGELREKGLLFEAERVAQLERLASRGRE